MRITADRIGKKFVREWIIRNASFELEAGQRYVFVGPNGSGKSTCLQLLTGMFPVSEGQITYTDAGKNIEIDDWYKHLVIAAPYMELIEEFTLEEHVNFHRKFKPFKDKLGTTEFLDFIQLRHASTKFVRHFSSGMKQRLKLGLALMSDVPVVILDEPTTNLDAQGVQWYLNSVSRLAENQVLLLGSNVPQEYEFCENIIQVSAFK